MPMKTLRLSCLFFTTITFFLVSTAAADAQYIQRDTSSYIQYHHNIGLSTSPLSGHGLSYRYAFTKGFQLQFNGIALQSDDNNDGYGFFGSVGTEIQFAFPIRSSVFGLERMYGIIGASYCDTDDRGYSGSFFIGKNNSHESMITTGIGLGIQSVSFSGFHFTLQASYFYRNRTTETYQKKYDQSSFAYSWVTDPKIISREITVGLGLGVYFAF